MEIIKVNVDLIVPYEQNAKKHPRKQIEQIKESIKEFGNNDPIAVDENNVIIEGHGRFIALRELGYIEVECIRLDNMDEEQKKAYRLVHNKLTMNSDFDLDVLMKELDEILAIDMEKYDFDISEPDELDIPVEGEVPFTEVLGEEHNYLVLYFDNDVDWLQALSYFDVKQVKALSTRKDGEIKKASERIGIGRVLKGSDALGRILKDENIG